HVAQFGHGAQLFQQARRPGVQVFKILALQGVLELGGAGASADSEVLRRLQVESGARDDCQFAAQAGNDLVGGDLALRQGLQGNESAAAVAAASAGECSHAFHGWILPNDVDEVVHLLGHGGKGNVLGGLQRPGQPARVLLREKPLGHDHVQINAEAGRRDGNQQRERLMAQHPTQGTAVDGEHAVKHRFAEAIDAAMVFLPHRTQELGAQCRGGSQRNQQRDRNGGAERNREFPEKTAHDAAHQQQGNEYRNERGAHGEYGKPDLAGAAEGGLDRAHAHFHVTGDVLQHHNGVIHHETGGDGQSHEREVIEAVAQQVHHREGTHQGERHGHTGNDRGARAAQKREHHQNDEDDGDEQGQFNVVHRGPNGGGAIERDIQVNGSRDRRLKLGQQGAHPVHGIHDVGAGLAENDGDDAVFSIRLAIYTLSLHDVLYVGK